MAERYAISAGNWVAARFDGGTLPGAGDTVHANGFAVTIDTSITVAALSTRPGTTAAAGGSFTGSGTVTITADTYGGTTTCLLLNSISQQQVGDSYGSDTTNNARGTLLGFGAKQIGTATAGLGGSTRNGTIASPAGVLIGDSYGSADNANSPGLSMNNGSTQIGNSYGVVGVGTTAAGGSRQYGMQNGGSTASGTGTEATSGSLIITTGITDGLAPGLRVNGSYVILQSGTTSGQVTQTGTASTIGETLAEFPYIVEGGGGAAGFTGIRGTSRRLGT